MLTLLGVAVVIVGFALRLNAMLVVVTAAIVTGLCAGLSVVEVLSAFGQAFNENRFVSAAWLVLPAIGVLERAGLLERARLGQQWLRHLRRVSNRKGSDKAMPVRRQDKIPQSEADGAHHGVDAHPYQKREGAAAEGAEPFHSRIGGRELRPAHSECPAGPTGSRTGLGGAAMSCSFNATPMDGSFAGRCGSSSAQAMSYGRGAVNART
jgi:hypothetical protein